MYAIQKHYTTDEGVTQWDNRLETPELSRIQNWLGYEEKPPGRYRVLRSDGVVVMEVNVIEPLAPGEPVAQSIGHDVTNYDEQAEAEARTAAAATDEEADAADGDAEG